MRDKADLMIKCLEMLQADSSRKGIGRILRMVVRQLNLSGLVLLLTQGEKEQRISYRATNQKNIKFAFRLPLENEGKKMGVLLVGCTSFFQHLFIRKFCRSLALLFALELGNQRREQILRREARLDSNLKIHNRNALEARKAKLRKRNAPRSIAAIYLDLNGLKEVNDRHGHEAGDCMLRRAVEFFAAFFPREHIYRAGGDEFVILESGLQREEFRLRAKELQQALSANTTPQAAMGIAWRARERFVEEVIKEADQNMYRDKNSTRGHSRVTLRRQL